MFLSIITINYNNSAGLVKTLRSILSQDCKDFEHIIVDGGSTDGSVEIIKQFGDVGIQRKWVSEKDKGIYNAMNKGICMATGDYVQFLNSGDCLVDAKVVGRMLLELSQKSYPSILYGNMLKDIPTGRIMRDRCFAGQPITFLGMFTGTLNHSPAYISRDLFDKYGYYDESLKIVSDWEWYLHVLVLGKEKPVYVDVDVTLFDMTGISETNKGLDRLERRKVLKDLFPEVILQDYERFAFPIEQIKRLQRFPWAYGSMWFLERCLFKWEKWTQKDQQYK